MVRRNAVILIVSQIVSKGVGLFALVVLTNYLGADLFGKYAFALAFATLFIPLMDFGMDTFGIREMARDHARVPSYLGGMLCMKLALAAVTFFLIMWIIRLLDYPAVTRNLVCLAAWITIVRTYTNSAVSVFRAHQSMEYEGLVLILQRVFEAIAAVLGVHFFLSIESILYWTLASTVLVLFLAFWIQSVKFRRPVFRFRWGLWKTLLKGGLPFTLTGVFVMVYFKISNVLLSKMVGDRAVGLYDSATNLIYPLTVISAAIVTALFPAVSKHVHREKEVAVRSAVQAVKFSLIIALPLALGIFMLADKIYLVLYKPEFAEAVRALQILSWLLPVIFITNVFGNTLGAADRQGIVFGISALNAAVNLILNILLIPRYGYNGSAAAALLTEIVGFFFLSHFLKKHFSRLSIRGPVIRTALYSLFLIPVFLLKNRLNVFLLGAGAAAVYAGVLFLFKEISTTDFAFAARMLGVKGKDR
jgi:O-antigen/teichoic acid export membrane protein